MLCDHLVLSILNFLTISNQALLHSLSKTNQETSKNLLKYLSRILTSVFKGSIGGWSGCCCWFRSVSDGGWSGHADLASVFPIIFVLYLNHLSSEALLLSSSLSISSV